jgi:hypothetical protein
VERVDRFKRQIDFRVVQPSQSNQPAKKQARPFSGRAKKRKPGQIAKKVSSQNKPKQGKVLTKRPTKIRRKKK